MHILSAQYWRGIYRKFFKKKIKDVFTPKSSDLNKEMYVSRKELEESLSELIDKRENIIIHGESGNGKSWLYKKVLSDKKIHMQAVNLSRAAQLGSIKQAIEEVMAASFGKDFTKTSYTEAKSAGLSANSPAVDIAGGFSGTGEIKHESQYLARKNDELLEAFKLFNRHYKDKEKVIVLDNLESIFPSERDDELERNKKKFLMRELANIVMLLDDPTYSKYKIIFLIVGTPTGILEYFLSIGGDNDSLNNRLKECPEVENLNKDQVNKLIEKGLNGLLNYNISNSNIEKITNHIYEITLGVAQQVQEYGFTLSVKIDKDLDSVNSEIEKYLAATDKKWLNENLKAFYQRILKKRNSNKTELQIRNKVIYCLSKIGKLQFTKQELQSVFAEEFPSNKDSQIHTALNELSTGDDPLLTNKKDNNLYMIKNPKIIMCIKVMMRKQNGSVNIININDIQK